MNTFDLKNGIPVVLLPMSGTQAVTALVLFKVGSRNEQRRTNGISHFLEHLFFKGTERRPTTLEISQELDAVGADYNAFTSKDYTGYYVKVAKQHTGLAVDMLEDILFHPLFESDEIDRERGVIIEEINMYEDNPMVVAEELSEQLLFGAQHPLGFRIAGPPENIMRITRKQILDYRSTYYHSNNMVIVLAGAVNQNVRTMIKKQFAHSSVESRRTPAYTPFRYTQRQFRIQVAKKETAQSHLALSFPGPTYTQRQLPAAQVLSAVLGGSMSSRLFINVRERQGLCYYIRSGITPYEQTGAFTIQAGFDTKRIEQAVSAIAHEVSTIAQHGITAEELSRAKDYLCGKMSIRLEDSEDVASWWAKQQLFAKKAQSPESAGVAIQQVTTQQVNAYARGLFKARHANLVIVGPHTTRQEKRFKQLCQLP